MPLVKVLSAETEAELVRTLQQVQILLASTGEAIQRIDRLTAKLERIADAVSHAGVAP